MFSYAPCECERDSKGTRQNFGDVERGSRKIAISREVNGISQICLRILADDAGVDALHVVLGLNHTYLLR